MDFTVCLFFTVCHFSTVFCFSGLDVSACVFVCSFDGYTVSFVTCTYFLASITYIAAFFASAGVLSSTCLSNMSVSVSTSSSAVGFLGVYRVFVLIGIVETSFK